MGVYIHVPFCKSRCRYCDFYSTASLQAMDDWSQAILDEISLMEKPKGKGVDTLYFGGGTPSLLDADVIGRIVDAVDSRYGIRQGAEITLEANPGSVSPHKLMEFRHAGVNRLHFGIQSLDEQELCFLGRSHSVKEALDAWDAGRRAGFFNMGLDLIYGLPGQGRVFWESGLKKALSLGPDHLSLYMLSIESDTPMGRDLEAGVLSAPDESMVADLLRFTLYYMDAAGYPWYEVSSFARGEEFQSRHNLGYWEKKICLGFGPGAHSYIHPLRWSNAPDLAFYINSVRQKQLPRILEEPLTRDGEQIEGFYLGFRTRKGLDIQAWDTAFGGSFHTEYGGLLDYYEQKGFLICDSRFCRLTVEGMVFLDAVTAAFCCS
ncbi:radical SAM family heme chaperone HemW [Desulfobotulus sp. H1]|uniref:Heme chaperone HemW n=1 Tax=Desulfobotulus pelophilus TaxID=2823377 RepID=A0ABT3NB44_9BACT|nr:radical SAM family heme chaperone HemW [Desulfobotulus pelophilus]MCW7754687.1 radical SAM family heme chaperone HemW [Desulfobotulus pelophilus]